MWFFRKQKRFGSWWERFLVSLEVGVKSFAMIILPIPIPIITCYFWYHVMYRNGIHFDERLEGIVTAAWLPTTGITYGLFASNVVNTVWTQYENMRTAVKCWDFRTFFLLRDEEISPLAHILLTVLAAAVILGFMGLKYPDPKSAMVLIGGLSYVFALIFVVVEEIDDPCAGIWFIKSIPKEWIEVDVKQWRRSNFDTERKEFATCLLKANPEGEIKVA